MKTYNVTKEDILKFHSWGNREDAKELEDRFPDVFEVELIVGEWYKTERFKGNFLIQIVDKDHWRGFNEKGEWENIVPYYGMSNDKDFVKATDLEVQSALIEETKKRYKKGDLIYIWKELSDEFKPIDFSEFKFFTKDNQLFVGTKGNRRGLIFDNGIWQEVIPTMTKQEAEEKLNCKII